MTDITTATQCEYWREPCDDEAKFLIVLRMDGSEAGKHFCRRHAEAVSKEAHNRGIAGEIRFDREAVK